MNTRKINFYILVLFFLFACQIPGGMELQPATLTPSSTATITVTPTLTLTPTQTHHADTCASCAPGADPIH